MNLFTKQDFIGHSGQKLSWKIECDALTDEDWETCAFFIAEKTKTKFGAVEGIPNGGLKLAAALQKYVTEGPLLIVDDVCTTGKSLEDHRAGRDAIGFVLFTRRFSALPKWCNSLWVLGDTLEVLRHEIHDQCELEKNLESLGMCFYDDYGALDMFEVIKTFIEKERKDAMVQGINDFIEKKIKDACKEAW